MPIHVRARPEDIAPFVLLPGDPGRARYVAETFLEGVTCYNTYRQLLGFTGYFQGKRVSIQATGMGSPSAAIIVREMCELGARTLVRIGTCGAMQSGLELGDLIIATSACAIDRTVHSLVGLEGFAPTADAWLCFKAFKRAQELGFRFHAGSVGSCDLFYDADPKIAATLARYNVLALEMEAALILTLGARERRKAACLLTVSDLIASGQRAPDSVILEGVDRMTRLALEGLLEADS